MCIRDSAGACFSIMQSTLIYQVAPAEMRGRLLGVMTICIGSGVIGFANIGLMADIFGATNALWVGSLEGVVPMIIIGFGWLPLRTGRLKAPDAQDSSARHPPSGPLEREACCLL